MKNNTQAYQMDNNKQSEYDSSTDPNNPDNHREHQFCTDMSCGCHEDSDEIQLLDAFYQEGLVSTDDADRIYHGKTL
jgi:hypothetical protein